MGYTHYWDVKKNISKSMFKKTSTECKKLLNAIGNKIKLSSYDEESGKPIFSDTEICFNGVGGESHEDFYLSQNRTDFKFCKTARKPYDLLVVGCLIVAKVTMGNRISVRSDGEEVDWQEGIDFVNKTLNLSVKYEDIVTNE